MSEVTEVIEALPNDSFVFHRTFRENLHHAVGASGSTITLATGQKILDACGGAGVSCIGQGREEVIEAAATQMRKAGYIHTGIYTTDAAEELSSFMLKGNPFGLERAFFVGSGSEAMDTALKLARQYFFEKGELKRTNYISRLQGYHGSTIGAMCVSSNLARKIPYEPLQLPNFHHVRPAYMHHYYAGSDADEEKFSTELALELEAKVKDLSPETVVAFVAEPVVGATTGCVTAPKGYFQKIRQVCDRYGILLILDEVMCGAGRTGTYWAFEQEGVTPDIVTLGKGLGGGYVPMAAAVANKKVVDVIKGGSSAFVHGHTYQAHPLCCATALAVQKIIRRENLVQRCKEMGKILEDKLRETFAGCKGITDIRGRGLFWGLEFYDTLKGKPFPAELKVGPRVQEAAFKRGVAVYPGTGTVDGKSGDHVLLAPAYTITVEEIDQMVQAARAAYDEVVGALIT